MERITFEESVAFILRHLDFPASEQRALRDKVRKRVTYALGNGDLGRVDVQTLDVDRNHLIIWARTKWPGRFTMPIDVRGQLAETVGLAAEADGFELPVDLAQCHDRIRLLTGQNRMLTMMLDQKASIIAELRPLAEQYKRNREKNRASAKKPRDGRG